MNTKRPHRLNCHNKENISTPTSIDFGKVGIFMKQVQQNEEKFEENAQPKSISKPGILQAAAQREK
jgi:hypothetical protein